MTLWEVLLNDFYNTSHHIFKKNKNASRHNEHLLASNQEHPEAMKFYQISVLILN